MMVCGVWFGGGVCLARAPSGAPAFRASSGHSLFIAGSAEPYNMAPARSGPSGAHNRLCLRCVRRVSLVPVPTAGTPSTTEVQSLTCFPTQS